MILGNTAPHEIGRGPTGPGVGTYDLSDAKRLVPPTGFEPALPP
jgi:hypothetical protein